MGLDSITLAIFDEGESFDKVANSLDLTGLPQLIILSLTER